MTATSCTSAAGDDRRRVTVVVPVRDGADLLAPCIDAMLAARTGDFDLDVVIVDDASTDASAAVARRLSASPDCEIAVVTLAQNRGFAGAVNCGVELALSRTPAPDALVLVNQDLTLSPGALAPLLCALEDPRIAVAGARLLDAAGTTLTHAGARIEPNGLTSHIGRGSQDAGAFRDDSDVDYVCGALIAMRTDVWRRFGPFDEGYAPVYFEDVDFCVAVRAAGLGVRYVAASEARHLEASTSGSAGSALFLSRYHRSRMRFVAKHAPTLRGWLRAEIAWLVHARRWSDIAPVVAAYARLPRLLLEARRSRAAARAGQASATPVLRSLAGFSATDARHSAAGFAATDARHAAASPRLETPR